MLARPAICKVFSDTRSYSGSTVGLTAVFGYWGLSYPLVAPSHLVSFLAF